MMYMWLIKWITDLRSIHLKFKSNTITRKTPLANWKRFIRWQIVSRLARLPIVVPFVNDTRLIAKKGMTGATGNIYFGLMEFEDMSFVLHFLRESEKFCDIGANIGAYTILASGVCRSYTFAIEPASDTSKFLMDNIRINDLLDRVKLEICAVGDENKDVAFTNGMDSTNHIVSENEDYNGQSVLVKMLKIDDLIIDDIPCLIKIDIEGYEYSALQGGRRILADPKCQAIIIEINGSGSRYNIPDTTVDEFIRSFGFHAVSYDPFNRILTALDTFGDHNTIYVKDVHNVGERLKSAQPFRVLQEQI